MSILAWEANDLFKVLFDKVFKLLNKVDWLFEGERCQLLIARYDLIWIKYISLAYGLKSANKGPINKKI